MTSEGHHSLIKSEGRAASKTPLSIRLNFLYLPAAPPAERGSAWFWRRGKSVCAFGTGQLLKLCFGTASSFISPCRSARRKMRRLVFAEREISMRIRDRAASKTLLLIHLIFYISLPLCPPKEAALGFGGEGNQYAQSGPGRF